jgi:HSP20 family protein
MNNLPVWSPPTIGELVRRPSPFAELDSWLREIFGAVGISGGVGGDFTPAAEVIRDGADAVVRLELPGVDVDNDVHVDVEDGRLVIHGERRDEHSEEENGRTVREVRYGSFRRSFNLPAHVTSDAVSASYHAGVLTVRVPGAYAGSQPHRIPISK